jgi:hypothetical protein
MRPTAEAGVRHSGALRAGDTVIEMLGAINDAEV